MTEEFGVVRRHHDRRPIERRRQPVDLLLAIEQEVPRVLGGLGITILSTPKGVMSGREAKKENVGGELLAFVW